jgi:hypothetical protein
VVASVAVNGLLAATFVALNAWALSQGLEETFVALALLYGLLSTCANALIVALRR